MFERARLKLTAWYLVIIMTISLLFSFTIYSSINAEFNRFERMQIKFKEVIEEGEQLPLPPRDHFIRFVKPDPEFIEDSRNRLIAALGLINLSILFLSGISGYFLAGRTLRPIKKIVDEQKRFITDASHELRTPITALRSEIEVALRNKTLSLPEAKKILVSNLEEVVSLQSLSDKLLELAQNGKFINPKNMKEVSLTAIIKTAMKKVEPLAKKKKITISSSVKEKKIRGIPERLIEVFVILLDNAIKYSPEKSTVTLASQMKDKHVQVSVADHGVGIDAKDLPLIFERFYRASKSRDKSHISGYGLGLSIAKKIIEAHHGTITVVSKPDKGTTFKVVFRMVSDNTTE